MHLLYLYLRVFACFMLFYCNFVYIYFGGGCGLITIFLILFKFEFTGLSDFFKSAFLVILTLFLHISVESRRLKPSCLRADLFTFGWSLHSKLT